MTFHEEQKFSAWFSGIGIILFLVLYLSLRQELSNSILLLIIVTSFLPIIIFLLTKLKTSIDHTGIHISFFPFIRNRNYSWGKDIIQAEVIKYSPIRDYGGWGIRKSFKNGTAYNIKGNQGIKLLLSNQKTLLIGTQKPQEVQRIINHYLKTNT